MVEKSVLIDALKKAKEQAPERKFTESVDMTINLKNIDMSQPKNRIDETILLPNGNGRVVKIAVLGSGDIVTQARESGVELIMGPEEIERLGGAPREARKVASEHQFFLAETQVMSLVGRWLGPRLGPRGRMPQPIPAGVDIRPIVERLRKSVKVRTKDKMSFSLKVGTTSMSEEEVAENIDAILKRILGKLEMGDFQVRSVYVKTTMGPSVKVEL
ncbi:50S ribosomal protein L1 [Methanospirillum purgamenti]|jgi:large subunit ribosomal protein L1|uniref:Large ribosomal subunit protein uL1 n=1 Tax=Methanospirillum hungatei TaxID=2203 RepID=A0A8F5ZHZ8_METHU|nr:50S ribosomal protein L1 [Methanospirillum hungatei]QXO95263.1 50S ribosomal protein L1 [Methanospirillum hungatei]